MKATIRYFLCISLLISHFSVETAYKAAQFTAKATATGLSVATIGLTADLLRNYTLYPNPKLAQSATLKDLDNAQRCAIKNLFDEERAHSLSQKAFDAAAPFLADRAENFAEKRSALAKEISAATTSFLNLDPIAIVANIAHLKLYPNKENCPCVERYDSCDAHKVYFPEALTIKAKKLMEKSEFK